MPDIRLGDCYCNPGDSFLCAECACALTAENAALRAEITASVGRSADLLIEVGELCAQIDDLGRARDKWRAMVKRLKREHNAKLAHWIDRARSSNRRPLTDAEQEEACRA